MSFLKSISRYRPFVWLKLALAYEKNERASRKRRTSAEGKNAEIQRLRCEPWFDANGDETLRLDYDLNESSVVFDLGGFAGDFASRIFDKYGSVIYVFEPVPDYCNQIKNRFSHNPKIKPICAGLADVTTEVDIYMGNDSTGLFGDKDAPKLKIKLISTDDFFKANPIGVIDLMKINIEGGEYALLEKLVATGDIKRFTNIQVQFHDFVIENAEARMHAIQKKLAETHSLTYQFPFVWENWQLKKEN